MLHVQPSAWKRGLKPAQFISWLSVYVQRSGFEVWSADLNLDETAWTPGYSSAPSVRGGQWAQAGVSNWLPDHLWQERSRVQIPAGGRWEHVNFMELLSWDTVCRETCSPPSWSFRNRNHHSALLEVFYHRASRSRLLPFLSHFSSFPQSAWGAPRSVSLAANPWKVADWLCPPFDCH